jgi:hypothetical protein
MELSSLAELGKVIGVAGVAIGLVALLAPLFIKSALPLPHSALIPVLRLVAVGALAVGALGIAAWLMASGAHVGTSVTSGNCGIATGGTASGNTISCGSAPVESTSKTIEQSKRTGGAGVTGDQLDRGFLVVNQSDQTIVQVEASNIGESSFAPNDLLGDETIPPHESATIEPYYGQGWCRFDIRITFQNGDQQEINDVNICDVERLTIHGNTNNGKGAQDAPLSKMAALGRKLDALPKGDIVLDAPTEMRVGDKRQVDANVGLNVAVEVLQKKSQAANQQITGQAPASQITGHAHISSDMIATLSGPGFKIDAITPETQTIAEGFPTVWSWNIEAKESGDQELEAVLYALVPNGETTYRQRVNSFTQKITVSVREKTVDEWLKSLGNKVDAVKAITVALGGIVTVVASWFGIMHARQRNSGSATAARKPKHRT